ncbi:MAG: isopentenyl transferase family protein, partial [Geminicoccaceae bacterium]
MTGLYVIAGPTASGKSALALRLAEKVGGMVINADSMQLYRDLRILTARPTPEDEARAPHRLYGVLDAEDPASAGRWLELAAAALEEARAARRPAIVVGGTGLYLHA